MNYDDHHIFNIDDLNNIKEKFNGIDEPNKIIITTEKDAVRFMKFDKELENIPVYVLPIEHQFLFEEANDFNRAVKSYIINHYNNQHHV